MSSLPPPPTREFLADIPFDFEAAAVDKDLLKKVINRAEELAKEKAIKYAKTFANEHGYSISIARSKKTGRKLHSSVREVVYMACSQSGVRRQRNPNSVAYKSSKTNCPFQMKLVLRYDYWAIEYVDVSHNHEATVIAGME